MKRLSYFVLLGLAAWIPGSLSTLADEPGPLLKKALQGPLKDVPAVVFCTRLNYEDPHWYANIGYYCDDENHPAYTGNGKPDTGRLLKWNPHNGEVTTLLDDPGGSIRDPQIHYDAQKLIFSWRKHDKKTYNLYEINLDGGGVKQLTATDDYDDYEPTYLPDGGIAFVSTRCKRWVNCWLTQVGTIHRCDADGSNIVCISGNTEHDNTPWPLSDGRLIYMRWEYVDRSQVEFHSLWTKNPDGTGEAVFYGNMRPGTVMIDAKPIPGTDDVIASFSPGHGINEHAGFATVVTPSRGPDDPGGARNIQNGPPTRDPIAVNATCFLAARDDGIVLMDGTGAVELAYKFDGPGRIHEPRPVLRHDREGVLASRAHGGPTHGQYVVADVYDGRNLPGVERGQIKKLLVLESLPKPVNFSGGPDLLTWLGTFTLERVLGTVPVEADGSASFVAPAGRQLFFVALDDHDLSVKRMQSFTTVMPGEVQSCVGCHEERSHTSHPMPANALTALSRAPSKIEPFDGFPDVIDFNRDIQPILDRHCVGCHNPQKREGKLSLAGDLGMTWSHSYYNLLAWRQVGDGRNGLGNQPPRSIGSAASPILSKLQGGHHDVKATPQEWRTVWLWTESGATYAGSYAALRNNAEQNRDGAVYGAAIGGCGDVIQRRCVSCHDPKGGGKAPRLVLDGGGGERWNDADRKRAGHPTGAAERIVFDDDPLRLHGYEIVFNVTRPELSGLLMGPLAASAGGWGSCGGDVFKNADDPDYKTMLESIRKGVAPLVASPRWATAQFRPNRQYVREMKRYGVLPADLDPAATKVDPFTTDQAYWKSLWPAEKPGE